MSDGAGMSGPVCSWFEYLWEENSTGNSILDALGHVSIAVIYHSILYAQCVCYKKGHKPS